MTKTIKSFKGFDKDMKCLGYQYEVGKTYTHEGDISVCNSGFHACENPLDVLNYYSDIDGKYCEVEQSGNTRQKEDKIASSEIRIVAEIGFAGLFKAGVEWIKKITNPQEIIKRTKDKNDDTSVNYVQIGSSSHHAQIGSSSHSAQIGSSGESAKIGSSGYRAQIGSSGDHARIGSSGESAKIGSSGYRAQIGSSGDYAQIGSSGESARIGSSGYSVQIGSSGYSVQIGSSGEYARIGSSGCFAQISSSSHHAQIGSSGDYAQIGSSGDSAQIDSSGYSARIGSSGYFAQIDSTGEDSVICCVGNNSKVKASKGSWITLSEWEYNETKKRNIPKCVKTEFVDGERIKADTWYELVNGEFKELL